MKNLAVIPARSGSKGLEDKNIRLLAGRPLLYYSIAAAQASGLFEEVMVSTDSEQYADVARQCGASVPFLRTAETSGDTASSWDAVREVLRCYAGLGRTFDTTALLQPTSPLRLPEDIAAAYEVFQKRNADAVVSVTEVEHPVQWCFPMSKDASMEAFARSPFHAMRRQDLETYYRENGAVFIVRTEKLRDAGWDIYSGRCFASPMPHSRSLDIDGIEDFRLAEFLLSGSASD